jgi:hypothetical protein
LYVKRNKFGQSKMPYEKCYKGDVEVRDAGDLVEPAILCVGDLVEPGILCAGELVELGVLYA